MGTANLSKLFCKAIHSKIFKFHEDIIYQLYYKQIYKNIPRYCICTVIEQGLLGN